MIKSQQGRRTLEKAGIPYLMRLSVGLETVDQIIQTIDEALNKKLPAFRQEANFKREIYSNLKLELLKSERIQDLTNSLFGKPDIGRNPIIVGNFNFSHD